MMKTIKLIMKKILSFKFISDFVWLIYSYSHKGKKAYNKFIETANKYVSFKNSNIRKNNKKLYVNYKYLNIKYGFDLVDYFLYQLYELSEDKIESYMSSRRRSELYDLADAKDLLHIMGNKKDFYSQYNKFMQKNCIFVEDESDKEKFEELCKNQEFVIVKPIDGQRGQGVEKVYVGNKEGLEKVWQKSLQNKLCVEHVLHNCKEIAIFHPLSLNTVRISTVIDGNQECHIMAATIRTGRGSNVVDNGHYDGVYAAVDVNTGIICSLGYNLLGEKFVKHPDSYVVFAGFQIPKWQELLKLAKNIASINHNLRYIGWDFVLTPNYEWLLLEGNEPGGIDIHQQPLNKGLYNEYKSLICG